MQFYTMRDARDRLVLYKRKHDGARWISAEDGDVVGEGITIYIGLGGDERHSVDIYHPR